MKEISSYHDFEMKSGGKERTFLLLYKNDSDQSRCALQNLVTATLGISSKQVFAADVSVARDIHGRFGIDSVPSLLIFNNGEFTNTIRGCHHSTYYTALLENSVIRSESASDRKISKQVTVYSTPTCSWCNTLKSWLQKNNIRYTDIDISRDQKAAEALVRRSGHQGVPQTDINGQIVVGFNPPMLKELLEIQ
jgi:glutaredoxin-like YruB-family protein